MTHKQLGAHYRGAPITSPASAGGALSRATLTEAAAVAARDLGQSPEAGLAAVAAAPADARPAGAPLGDGVALRAERAQPVAAARGRTAGTARARRRGRAVLAAAVRGVGAAGRRDRDARGVGRAQGARGVRGVQGRHGGRRQRTADSSVSGPVAVGVSRADGAVRADERSGGVRVQQRLQAVARRHGDVCTETRRDGVESSAAYVAGSGLLCMDYP